jgi:hypothetical protein
MRFFTTFGNKFIHSSRQFFVISLALLDDEMSRLLVSVNKIYKLCRSSAIV